MAVEWLRVAYDDEIINREFDIVEKSDNYSMVVSDFGYCFVLTGGTNKTFTLPNASTLYLYKRIRCSVSGTATLRVEPYSGGTINNKSYVDSTHQYAWIEFMLIDANDWLIYSNSKLYDSSYEYGSWDLAAT
jgi:hypothetical protein